jgi:histidine triad (HIT) family protein
MPEAVRECIFCAIVAGKMPCYKIYEDSKAIAFLDINPASKGHCLVVPKQHFENIFDIPEDVLAGLAAAIKAVAGKIKTELAPAGLTIMQNSGRAAGQIVPHIHFHLIPRNAGDGIVIGYKPLKFSEAEWTELQRKLKIESEKESRSARLEKEYWEL